MIGHLVLLCVVMVHSLCNSQEKPYNFEPANNHLDVTEGDKYYIVSFSEISNQTAFDHCYYHSDTISGDYPISLNKSDDKAEDKVFILSRSSRELTDYLLGKFSSYNNTGICAFTYNYVDDRTPLRWTITAHDNITDTNFTEVVTITFFYAMPLYLDNIIVLPTASYANFFYSGDTKLQNCSLVFNNLTINLDMDTAKVYDDDNILKSRLSSFGDGKCGYKITTVQQGDPKRMTLFATDAQNKTYRNQSAVVVISNKDLENRTQQVYLGSSATVSCGTGVDSDVSYQKFCYLYNPKGALASHDIMCYYNLDIVTLDDLGIWRCTVGHEYIMNTLKFTTELVQLPPEKIEPFTEDTTNYFIIGCKLLNFDVVSIKYCKFTRPDGKLFQVDKGGATEYYNTFTSDLDNGKCALDILKPLRELDKGTWKCEAVLFVSGPTGTFVDVEKSTSFSYSKRINKNIHLGNAFVVDCVVPFPSDYCYIIAPNGTQYRPTNNFAIMSGECMFTVAESTPTDHGPWTCSIAQQNGLPDETITVEISIIELKVLYVNAEVVEGEEVDLICNTNGIPLEYCRFVSPIGIAYSLRKEDTTNSNNITYLGRGLEYGDCGINISQVQHLHNGQWSCHISSGRESYAKKVDVTRQMILTVRTATTSPSLAESVGIAAGVLVVIIATGGFIFYRYSKRRRTNEIAAQYATGRSSGSSTGSGGETVLLQIQQGTASEGQVVHRAHRIDESQPQQV